MARSMRSSFSTAALAVHRTMYQDQVTQPPTANPIFGPKFDQHKNLAIANITVGPGAPGFNTLTVTTGYGQDFPTPPFNATVWPQNTTPTPINAEIIRVVAVDGDQFLFSRAIEWPFIAVGFDATYQVAETHTALNQTTVEALFARGLVFDVRDNYGGGYAVLDDGTNDWGPIQAAVDKAGNAVAAGAPGALVLIPGRAAIASTVVINQNGVTLYGLGGGYTSDSGNYTLTAPSSLRWVGPSGGTMVQATPIPGASAQALKGFRLMGLMLDGAFGAAGIMLQLMSCQGFTLSDFFFTGSSIAGLDMSCLAAGSIGEAHDTARGMVSRGAIRQVDGSGTGIGIRLNGTSVANTNLNLFQMIEIIHSSGKGVQHLNSDSNLFNQLVINRTIGGTGIGIEESGSNTSAALASRNNHYISGTAGLGGLTVRGTGLTFPAGPTYWTGYQQGNGEPAPTVEAGGILFWTPNGGLPAGPVSTPAVGAPAALTTPAAVIPGSVVVVPPQGVQPGLTLEWLLDGLQTTTALAQGSPFVLRYGAAGTAADGVVATMGFPSAVATAVTAAPFQLRVRLVVRTGGGSASSYVTFQIFQTGTAAAPTTVAGMIGGAYTYTSQVAGTAFNGVAPSSGQTYFSLSYIGAAAQSITPELCVCTCLKSANP